MKIKGIILQAVSALMLGVYLLGIVGVDIHSCQSSGKNFVVSLWGGIDCCDIHPEADCASLCCTHCHHAGNAVCGEHTHTDKAGNSLTDDCCTDDCHYLSLTGETSHHDDLLAQITCPVAEIATPATDEASASILPWARIITPSGTGASSPDVQSLLSIFRI